MCINKEAIRTDSRWWTFLWFNIWTDPYGMAVGWTLQKFNENKLGGTYILAIKMLDCTIFFYLGLIKVSKNFISIPAANDVWIFWNFQVKYLVDPAFMREGENLSYLLNISPSRRCTSTCGTGIRCSLWDPVSLTWRFVSTLQPHYKC